MPKFGNACCKKYHLSDQPANGLPYLYQMGEITIQGQQIFHCSFLLSKKVKPHSINTNSLKTAFDNSSIHTKLNLFLLVSPYVTSKTP